MKVFDEPLGESNTERRVKVSAGISKEGTDKILEFRSSRRHQDFPKIKIYTNHLNQNIFGGGNFLGGTNSGGGKLFPPTKMFVFAMVIVFLTFLGLGIKFSRWGKNSLGGVKIHQVGTSETVRYVRSSS